MNRFPNTIFISYTNSGEQRRLIPYDLNNLPLVVVSFDLARNCEFIPIELPIPSLIFYREKDEELSVCTRGRRGNGGDG